MLSRAVLSRGAHLRRGLLAVHPASVLSHNCNLCPVAFFVTVFAKTSVAACYTRVATLIGSRARARSLSHTRSLTLSLSRTRSLSLSRSLALSLCPAIYAHVRSSLESP